MRNVLAAVLCIAMNPRNTPTVILRQRRRARKRATPNEGSLHLLRSAPYIDLGRRRQKGGLSLQCDKNDYRGILAGLEGVSGKKAVDSETMTVKN
jgi:hypothetical protein